MSEKRFELYSDDYFVGAYDNVTQEKINVLKSIDLLNSFSDVVLAYDKTVAELKKENEKLRQTMQKVCELLEEEVDLFSDKATEHDVIAYKEMNEFDNKDAYYMCISTKKAIKMLQRCLDE